MGMLPVGGLAYLIGPEIRIFLTRGLTQKKLSITSPPVTETIARNRLDFIRGPLNGEVMSLRQG